MIVSCVWVKGNVPYTAEYVFRLRSMVAKNLPIDHEFCCLTDRPEELEKLSCVAIKIPTPPPGQAGWWSKLELFNRRHGLRGEGLYLDLDVLIVQSILPVVNFSRASTMALVPHAGDWNGRNGLKVVKKYNSSVMRFRHDDCFDLYERWRPQVARQLWGDQDWIGQQRPGEEVMPLEWFPRLSQIDCSQGRRAIPGAAKVILCKSPKNDDAARRWRWFDEAWR